MTPDHELIKKMRIAYWSRSIPEQPDDDAMRAVLAVVREHDGRDAERYRQMLFERGAMETAPCFCCGYNGPGYFQPDTHPCAVEHHAAIASRQSEVTR